ncbi:MAG: hypothetical protein ACR2RF_11305 [Geminicoccaceae bacterium]
MDLGIFVWLIFLTAPIAICVLAMHQARTKPDAEGIWDQDALEVARSSARRSAEIVESHLKQEEERMRRDERQQYYDWQRSRNS